MSKVDMPLGAGQSCCTLPYGGTREIAELLHSIKRFLGAFNEWVNRYLLPVNGQGNHFDITSFCRRSSAVIPDRKRCWFFRGCSRSIFSRGRSLLVARSDKRRRRRPE